ncbi:O-succinylbenzoic acid--CoA ligase [Agromyces hippuratus]|uniref:O-succinylbenzoic acid--CoA ligase n=1 Tax=Agromyces hippuratus TaxID=286438 RepID=A0A852WWU7_9MICO|nr:AMP-binding protein [Agromyces hippuratus]NYG22117.1 O-succinylbenzoic acid--CoA ligase [Agromyces hippuratus]
MKPLRQVSAADVAGLTEALREALAGGDAVWPVSDAAGLETGAGRPPRPTEVDDDMALVVETSGSTDAPKRVMLSADALIASADATADRLDGPGRWLLALPGHYVAGAQVLVRSILAGTAPVPVDDGPFTPEGFAAASARLSAETPRYTSLVPVQLARILDRAERDAFVAAALSGYDAVLVGGQALAPELVIRADRLGARVVRTYGSSETAGGCVYDGRPLDGVGVRLVDGLVELSGPMLAAGYLGAPERTAATFTTDARGTRWYRTGDLGDLAPDGLLSIRGRADDVIISGGVKVALGEVERAIRGVPGFAEAVVVAVDDADWGQRPAVAVASREMTRIDLPRGRNDASRHVEGADVAALATATDAAGLAPAARPVRLLRLDALPQLASGKPDRRQLARMLAESAGSGNTEVPGGRAN